MKLEDARLTMLINAEYTEIRIEDALSNTEFVKIKLTPIQLSQVLSRLSYVQCACEVQGLDKLGKKHENKSFEFEIPKSLASSDKKEQLHKLAIKSLIDNKMDEWEPDKYYASQGTFFTNNEKQYARTTIRRWVE